ncbi:MAG: TatD family hydrolase [Turneriella sp.]
MELVDIQDLKSWGSNAVPVQFRPRVNSSGEPEPQRHRIIDSHCHLDMVLERGLKAEEISETLAQNGVDTIVQIGADEKAMQWARSLAHTSKAVDVYYTIGHHPGEAKSADASFGLRYIQQNKDDERFVAVGEIGLDYYYHKDEAEEQKKVFVDFVRAAREVGRGVAIHTRDAHRDTVEILKREAAGMPVLIHCFTGNRAEMEEFLAMGCFISFSGIVTFKNAVALQEAAKACPAERLMVETDAPFLAPVPFRGKVNQPGYVRHTLAFLARLRGEDEAVLAAACLRNTQEFYRIKA